MRLLLWTFISVAAALQAGAKPSRMNMDEIDSAIRHFDGSAGLAAVNLGTGEEVLVNADLRFPTASAIKIAVMLEAWHQVAEGTLSMETMLTVQEGDKVGGSGVLNGMSHGLRLTVGDLVHLMIVLSDNSATNMLVERLGTKKIDDRLQGYGLEHTRIFRPTFRDGKPDVYPKLEREFGLGMSTPREMARLMALIAEGRAVNPAASASMVATLRRQQDRAMIPRLLPGAVQVGNKTGTDSEKQADPQGKRGAIRVDAAIVTSEKIRYVIAIFVRRGTDTRGGVDNEGVLLGAKLSRLVYEGFTR
ncbi:MAG: serine hydrolase [Acidobacteria bacterium]|nr:serine hydrolase [Acidobacteriota bacterium]